MADRYPWRRIAKDGHTLSTPDFLTAKVNTLARALKRYSAKAYPEAFDITVTEWRTLAAIIQRQPCGVSDLALHLGSDKALIGRLLKKLEQRRLISIDEDPDDRRAVVVRATAAGDVAYRKIMPFAQQRQAALLRLLTETEREQFWTIVERLIVHVDALSDGDGDTEVEP